MNARWVQASSSSSYYALRQPQFAFIFSEQSQCSAIFPFSIPNSQTSRCVLLVLSAGSGISFTKLSITKSPSATIATTDEKEMSRPSSPSHNINECPWVDSIFDTIGQFEIVSLDSMRKTVKPVRILIMARDGL